MVSRVSRRFYHHAFDASLWRNVDLSARKSDKVTDEVAIRLLSLSKNVLSVNLPCKLISNETLDTISNCSNLRWFKLYRYISAEVCQLTVVVGVGM